MSKCPICGKKCKNAFYLGRHVAQKSDKAHTYDQDSKPNLSKTIEDNSKAENSSSEPDNSGSDSSMVEWEEENNDGFRDLNPEDPMESKLIAQGNTEINMEKEEVR